MYNIGSDEPIRLRDLAYKVRDLLNKDIDVRILGEVPDSSYKRIYVPDVSKFKRDFGQLSTKSLDDSIMEMAKT